MQRARRQGQISCGMKTWRMWGTFRGRGGQALFLTTMALLILLFALLWMADVHRIIFVKDRSQNAGDAAALAGARWQASTLNLIGELNLAHAMALVAGVPEAVDAITNTQLRVCYTGPMTGVAAAQQGAKLNGMYVNETFTEWVREHAQKVRQEYGKGVGGVTALPEPWEGAWEEYAAMLEALADEGIAAGIDNAKLFSDPSGGHLLLTREFYEAILGRDWCWFYRVAPDLLETYVDFRSWGAIPTSQTDGFSNSEFLGLSVIPYGQRFSALITEDELVYAFDTVGLSVGDVGNAQEDPVWQRDGEVWFFYHPAYWGGWTVMKDGTFPMEGELKDEFDYEGADAVMRVEAPLTRWTSNGGTESEDTILWTGAAKPFGYFEQEGQRVAPTYSQWVLPAYREVHLIPMDASSGSSGGSFDLTWRRHCEEHLPHYCLRGPQGGASCRYCRALKSWEEPRYRAYGRGWLSTNAWQCTIRFSGGEGGGGTRRAH